jgi:hypothetical protein
MYRCELCGSLYEVDPSWICEACSSVGYVIEVPDCKKNCGWRKDLLCMRRKGTEQLDCEYDPIFDVCPWCGENSWGCGC